MSYIETNLPRPVTDVIADLSKYIKNIDLFIGIIYFLMSIFFMKIASFQRKYNLAIKSSSGQLNRQRKTGICGNP